MIKKTRKSNAAATKIVAAKPETAKAAPVPAPTPKPGTDAVRPALVRMEAPRQFPIATVASTPGIKTASSAARISLELIKPGAKQVCVAGSFNGWKPESAPLVSEGNGRWVGNLNIKPGRYEYLFVVDGQWLPDPNAKETVQNPFGGKNSVLTVSA